MCLDADDYCIYEEAPGQLDDKQVNKDQEPVWMGDERSGNSGRAYCYRQQERKEPFVENFSECGHKFDYLERCPDCGNMEWDQQIVHSAHGTWDYLGIGCLCCGLTMKFRLEDPYEPRWGKEKDYVL